MSLSAGIRLGPLRIPLPIGAVGMGVVYGAKDMRLNNLEKGDALGRGSRLPVLWPRSRRRLAPVGEDRVYQAESVLERRTQATVSDQAGPYSSKAD
jgi:hypothetical protein